MSGLDFDGRISVISLNTFSAMPGRVGRGHVISVLAPISPSASGTLSTCRRMVIAIVCQPLAASVSKMVPAAPSSLRWNGCGS